MNERIKELFIKVSTESYNMRWNIEDAEMFAELIVRECVEAIQNKSMNSGDEWEDGLVIAESAIKEHFGVEE